MTVDGTALEEFESMNALIRFTGGELCYDLGVYQTVTEWSDGSVEKEDYEVVFQLSGKAAA